MRFYLIALICLTLLPSMANAKQYEADYIGETQIIRAKYEDTLVHLARDNNLGFVEMRSANPGLDAWIPGEGAKITLPTKHLLPDAPRKGIVINLSDMRLYFFPPNGAPPVTYSIGIGREGLNTPLGQTTIVRKKDGPTWTPTPRMRREDPTLPQSVPPGPDNPMGTHAMYLGFPMIAVHGTNKPYGIGRRVSSGCIRMYPEGIKSLFPRVPVGTQVTVVDQPVKVGWIGDEMFIEVHPTQDQSIKIEEDGQLSAYEITKEDLKRISAKAGDHANKIDWAKVREAVRAHSGIPVAVLHKDRMPGARAKAGLSDLAAETGVDAKELKQTAEKLKESAASKANESKPEVEPASVTMPPRRSSFNFNN